METKIAAGNARALQIADIGSDGFTEERRKRFLDTLAATCNVSIAARASGMASSSCYRLRARDAGFAAAWATALAIGYDRLESALLEYALSRVEGEAIDPDAAMPEDIAESEVAKLAARTVCNADLQFAVGLLHRHRDGAGGRRSNGRTAKRATTEETDAALRRKLDALARRMPQA